MRENRIPALLAANYFSHDQVEQVAERTGAEPLIMPEHVGGAPGTDGYFDLVDLWVSSLAGAFQAAEDEE
jgi:ABC-type Zn uptake system ZnuABC Zn-binding protein ZnuA